MSSNYFLNFREKLETVLNDKESVEKDFDELNCSHNVMKNQLKESEQTINSLRERYSNEKKLFY